MQKMDGLSLFAYSIMEMPFIFSKLVKMEANILDVHNFIIVMQSPIGPPLHKSRRQGELAAMWRWHQQVHRPRPLRKTCCNDPKVLHQPPTDTQNELNPFKIKVPLCDQKKPRSRHGHSRSGPNPLEATSPQLMYYSFIGWGPRYCSRVLDMATVVLCTV